MAKKKEQPQEKRRTNDPNRFTWVEGDIEIVKWPKGKKPKAKEEESEEAEE